MVAQVCFFGSYHVISWSVSMVTKNRWSIQLSFLTAMKTFFKIFATEGFSGWRNPSWMRWCVTRRKAETLAWLKGSSAAASIVRKLKMQSEANKKYWQVIFSTDFEAVMFPSERGLAFRLNHDLIRLHNFRNLYGTVEMLAIVESFLTFRPWKPSNFFSTVCDEIIILIAWSCVM